MKGMQKNENEDESGESGFLFMRNVEVRNRMNAQKVGSERDLDPGKRGKVGNRGGETQSGEVQARYEGRYQWAWVGEAMREEKERTRKE